MQNEIEAAMARGAKNRAKKALAAAKAGTIPSAPKSQPARKIVHQAKVQRRFGR